VILGLIFALTAALGTGVGSVLQALAARRVPAGDPNAGDRAQATSVGRLLVSPLYLAGLGMDALGFCCVVVALHWLPLFLVQCAAASSVGVTALAGRRVLGVVLGRSQLIALGGLGIGLVLLAAGAKAEAASVVPHPTQWWLFGAAVMVVLTGLAVARRRQVSPTRAGGILATIAGLCFAVTGVASRMLSAAHSVGDVVSAPASYALVLSGVGGLSFYAAALQRTAVTTAEAALFGVETITASAVGLLALGDSTRAGFAVTTALGFAVTLACALALALSQTAHATRPGDALGPPAAAED
jgi:hypothetical protein